MVAKLTRILKYAKLDIFFFGELYRSGNDQCDPILLNAFSSTGRLLYLEKMVKQLSNLIKKGNAEPV